MIRAETPIGTTQYRYDAMSRRIAKHTAQGETRFQYDGRTCWRKPTTSAAASNQVEKLADAGRVIPGNESLYCDCVPMAEWC
nr:hypothetical protein [Methylomonas fluvii]